MIRARRLALLLLPATAALAHAAEPFAPAEVEAARDSVLARPEFDFVEEGSETSTVARFLFEALGWVQQFRNEHPVAFWSIVGVLVLVLIGLIAHIIWTMRMAGEGRYQRERIELEDALRRADPAPFRKRALELAWDEKYDEAVQALYVALLLTLDRAGHVHYARHKALLDYQLETAGDPHLRRLLDQFAGTYHPGSFGRRPPDRAHFDELVAALDGVSP